MDGLQLNKDGLEFQINDFEFVFDSTGNLIARHTDTGNELVFNSDGSLNVSSIDSDSLEAANLVVNGVDFDTHSLRHEDGGADELDLTGLSGDLADAQDPKTHAGTHTAGGSDPLDPEALDGSAGQDGEVLVSDGTSLSFSPIPPDPVSDVDRAETFTESDVTVTGLDPKDGSLELPPPFDLTDLSFSTSINAQGPLGIAWNNDGTKLYGVSRADNLIFESELSTPFDITTATPTSSISTQDGTPEGIAWNDDGTKLYEVGSGSALIYELDLSTPFDITTATFSASVATNDDFVGDIEWNNDGTKLFEIGRGSNLIYESDLSTPFDITTATLSTSDATQDSSPGGLAWNDDGTKLYEVGLTDDKIYESELSTPFDVTTATPTVSVAAQDSQPRDVAWNNDGTKLFEVGTGASNIYESVLSGRKTGTATVEFQEPEDIFRWDAVSFTETEDGETVQVNIEVDDGTGFVETQSDVSRGEIINAAADDNVRFTVDLSRTDSNNTPTLDSLYRRYIV